MELDHVVDSRRVKMTIHQAFERSERTKFLIYVKIQKIYISSMSSVGSVSSF